MRLHFDPLPFGLPFSLPFNLPYHPVLHEFCLQSCRVRAVLVVQAEQ